MKPYPMEFREDAIRQVELGELSQKEIADVFGIRLSCLEKLGVRKGQDSLKQRVLTPLPPPVIDDLGKYQILKLGKRSSGDVV